MFRCHGTAGAYGSLPDDLVAHLRGAAADIPDRSPVRRRQTGEGDSGVLRQVADRVGPRRVGDRHCLARRHLRGEGEGHFAGVHRYRGDASRLAVDGHGEVPGCRLRSDVESLDVRQGQLLALDLRFGEGRSDAVDLVCGLIGAPPVRQIRVDGGAVLEEEDAAVVELEAVGVDGGAVIVLVGGLHRVLEQELGRGRAAFIIGLAHGGADGQVDLRRSGDRHRLAEGRGHVQRIVQFVGVVLPRRWGRGEGHAGNGRRRERPAAARIGPRSFPLVVFGLHLDLVGPSRAQAGDRAARGRAAVGPGDVGAGVAVLHVVVGDDGTGVGRLGPAHRQAALGLIARRRRVGLAGRLDLVFDGDGDSLRSRHHPGVRAAGGRDLHEVFVVASRIGRTLEVRVVLEAQLVRAGDLEPVPVGPAGYLVAGDGIVPVDILGGHPADEPLVFIDLEGIAACEDGRFVLVGDGDGDRLLRGQGASSGAAGGGDRHVVLVVPSRVRGFSKSGASLKVSTPALSIANRFWSAPPVRV